MQTDKKQTNKQSNQLYSRPFWEPNSSSAGQKILRILRNSDIIYGAQKDPAPVPIVCQMMLSICRRFREIAKSDY
jgi:hypothetical protein